MIGPYRGVLRLKFVCKVCWHYYVAPLKMYTIEISFLIVIIILLISNYVYRHDSVQVKVPTNTSQYQAAKQVNCQECTPSTKVKCKVCPVDCYKCGGCDPNCDLCNTDCQKCKTGSCQPSCDRCLSSNCKPDCDRCAESCTLDCSRLKECTLPYKECKVVGESLSFDLVGHAIYNRRTQVTYMMMTVITNQDHGHLVTLVNSNSIISLFITDMSVKVNANINNNKFTFMPPWGQSKLEMLVPGKVYLALRKTSLLLIIDGRQFSIPGPLDTSQLYTMYLGGLPYNLRDQTYFTEDLYAGFTGCLTNIYINNTVKTPQEFMLRGAQVGCPRKYLPTFQ